MKVSYPLSLKVSVWLVLNLLLLAGAAIGFFVVQGGVGWNALLAGPAGEHVQATANAIAAEVAAGSADTRSAILARFSATHGADFYLFRMDDDPISNAASAFPSEVRSRIEMWPPRMGGPGEFGRPFGEGRMGGPGPRRGGPPPNDGREPPDMRRREPPPDALRRPPPESGSDRERGRFIIRAGTPASYWVGLRVSSFLPDRGRPSPTILIAHVSSLWGLLRLLDLQSWLFAGTVVLVLSVLFWLPLVRGITHAVSQLTTATEQIADGRFETRVPARRRDEIGKLGESVNRMAARLDAHMTGQKRFLGDVAHELCSPLARLQMATGILVERTTPELRETVADVRDEVQQMSNLVNELLAFTKVGLQAQTVTLTDVEVAPLVQQMVAREGGNERITIAVPPDLLARAEPQLLARALGNLVRNALRYTGDGAAIQVIGQREGGLVVLAIEDEGPGVPGDALDRLGEPFFRPEFARTRELGGVGLGLSIVRGAMAACGGEVRFANRKPRGFRAELRLAAV